MLFSFAGIKHRFLAKTSQKRNLVVIDRVVASGGGEGVGGGGAAAIPW